MPDDSKRPTVDPRTLVPFSVSGIRGLYVPVPLSAVFVHQVRLDDLPRAEHALASARTAWLN